MKSKTANKFYSTHNVCNVMMLGKLSSLEVVKRNDDYINHVCFVTKGSFVNA